MADPLVTALRSLSLAAGIAPDVASSLVANRDRLIRTLLQAPSNPTQVVPNVVGSALDGLGERNVRLTLAMFADEAIRSGVQATFIRFDVSQDAFRTISSTVVEPVVRAAGVRDASLRASLIAAHLGGLVAMRYGAKVEPLASVSDDVIVAWYAPIIQQLIDPTQPLAGT